LGAGSYDGQYAIIGITHLVVANTVDMVALIKNYPSSIISQFILNPMSCFSLHINDLRLDRLL
jgi:hypothetical protein